MAGSGFGGVGGSLVMPVVFASVGSVAFGSGTATGSLTFAGDADSGSVLGFSTSSWAAAMISSRRNVRGPEQPLAQPMSERVRMERSRKR
jgi:hypothetical protein